MERISESDVDVQERIHNQAGIVEVFKVKHIRTGRTLCMKKISVNNTQEATAIQDKYLKMETLQHDNIVKLVSASLGGQGKTITHLLIFSEYCEEGNLENLIKRCAAHQYFSEFQLISYLEMLVDAFLYMQNNNLAHRDINPQNIFVCENGTKLKVGGLGSASQQKDSVVNNILGISLYLCPLLKSAYTRNLKGISHNVYKSDVYSLGLSFLYLASLKEVDDFEYLDNIEQKTESRIKELSEKYPTLSEILKEMLYVDESLRYDFITLNDKLKNSRLSGILNWQICNEIRIYKKISEITNQICSACLRTQHENDLFVFNSGLICKTCRENFLNGSELKKLKHNNHYLFDAPSNCECKRFCEYCHKSHGVEFSCFHSSKMQCDRLYFSCSKCDQSQSLVTYPGGSYFLQCSNSHYYCSLCLKPAVEHSHAVCRIIFIGFPQLR